ncbi:MAG: type II toxin-antitoxin system HicB family antitoxin [Candidatus Lindowbacteria bacterium]|nr:type II toxin-antitoxin system HicB family antitoxin [Candidatus Lindowbacteria bacterium]
MKTYVFEVTVEKDQFEDGREAYHAYCPALKGCHTWGHTYNEALKNIQEAVELYVEDLMERGECVTVSADKGIVEVHSPSVAVTV